MCGQAMFLGANTMLIAPDARTLVLREPLSDERAQRRLLRRVNREVTALLATEEGGTLICCNNVARVGREDWLDQLERSARKAGRPLRAAEWIIPEADFPSRDDNPPLKVLLLRV